MSYRSTYSSASYGLGHTAYNHIGLGSNKTVYETVREAADRARGLSITPINPGMTVTPIHPGMTVTPIGCFGGSLGSLGAAAGAGVQEVAITVPPPAGTPVVIVPGPGVVPPPAATAWIDPRIEIGIGLVGLGLAIFGKRKTLRVIGGVTAGVVAYRQLPNLSFTTAG